MIGKHHKRRTGSEKPWLSTTVFCLFGLLLIYFLSSSPVFWATYRTPIYSLNNPPSTNLFDLYNQLYAPLEWLDENTILSGPLNSYWNLFSPTMPDVSTPYQTHDTY
jgi:hypothetical protein